MELQVVYIFILAIITVTLVAVGIYVVLVLKELRETIQKVNLIVEDVEHLTDAISHPMNIISSIVQGFKAVKSLREED